jgi:hypothetical protein
MLDRFCASACAFAEHFRHAMSLAAIVFAMAKSYAEAHKKP